MKRIYISGPITGMPDLNFPAFHAEAKRLRDLGYEVINPVEINPDPTAKWEVCMRADITAMMTCDTICLLPGWANSRGATLELHIAKALAFAVVYASLDDFKRVTSEATCAN